LVTHRITHGWKKYLFYIHLNSDQICASPMSKKPHNGYQVPISKLPFGSSQPHPSCFLSLTLSPFTPWWAGRIETGRILAGGRPPVDRPRLGWTTVRRLPISYSPSRPRRRRVSRAGSRRRRRCRSARRHRRWHPPIRLENLVVPRGLRRRAPWFERFDGVLVFRAEWLLLFFPFVIIEWTREGDVVRELNCCFRVSSCVD
jgi:hypothetical protein